MSDITTNNIAILIASFFLFSIAGYIVLHVRRKKKAARAADAFKKKVLSELKGLYPITRFMEPDEIDRIKASLPMIKSAAAEFRPFLSPNSRESFDSALKNYSSLCNTITWGDCVTFRILPATKKPEDIGPKEVFRQNVNALLSFTEQRWH
jgi:hypothetical protein